MEWSPRGSYLATVHRQGVAVWGGKTFTRLQRVAHPGVQRLLLSPCERYLLTFSEFPDGKAQRPHVRFWLLFVPVSVGVGRRFSCGRAGVAGAPRRHKQRASAASCRACPFFEARLGLGGGLAHPPLPTHP